VSAGNLLGHDFFSAKNYVGLGGLEVLSIMCFEVLNSLKEMVLLLHSWSQSHYQNV